MNKQVLLALGMIVFIGAVVASGTGAFFSSQAAAVGNSFSAGSLDLMLTREDDGANPEETKSAQWEFTNMAPGGAPQVESIWLRNVGSIPGTSLTVQADFSGQGGIAQQMRITTLTWDGMDLLAASTNGAGADLSGYMAPTNCDINVTDGGPYQSINSGIAAASDGDVICASGGDYHTVWEGNGPVVVDKEVTILSTTGPANHKISAGVVIDADNVTISGFTITPTNLQPSVDAGIYIDGTHSNVTISGNEIDGTGIAGTMRGILTETGALLTNVTITNNELHDLATGIYVNPVQVGSNLVVSNNSMFGNNVGMSNDNPNGTIVQYNSIINNTLEGVGVLLNNGDSITISNNELFGSATDLAGYGTDQIDATNNWWGDADPSDQITGNVNYTPFLTGPVATSNLDLNSNGYFDLHDFRAGAITNITPGLNPYSMGASEDKEFVMAVQLDSSTGNNFQNAALTGVNIEFTLNQN